LVERLGAALRGTFIIDPDGLVRAYSVQDLTVGRSVVVVCTGFAVRAVPFQYSIGDIGPKSITTPRSDSRGAG